MSLSLLTDRDLDLRLLLASSCSRLLVTWLPPPLRSTPALPVLQHTHPHSKMNIVESLFGRSKTPAERLRQHQRSLQKAQRELDRERTKLEQQEKKLIIDIKKSAKDGQMVRVCSRIHPRAKWIVDALSLSPFFNRFTALRLRARYRQGI